MVYEIAESREYLAPRTQTFVEPQRTPRKFEVTRDNYFSPLHTLPPGHRLRSLISLTPPLGTDLSFGHAHATSREPPRQYALVLVMASKQVLDG